MEIFWLATINGIRYEPVVCTDRDVYFKSIGVFIAENGRVISVKMVYNTFQNRANLQTGHTANYSKVEDKGCTGNPIRGTVIGIGLERKSITTRSKVVRPEVVVWVVGMPGIVSVTGESIGIVIFIMMRSPVQGHNDAICILRVQRDPHVQVFGG